MLMKSVTTFVISALVGACVACGTGEEPLPKEPKTTATPRPVQDGPAIDKELQYYVDLFIDDCEVRRKDCKMRLSWLKEIKVVEMEDKDKTDQAVTVGLCYLSIFSRRVHINKVALEYSSRYVQTLVYHELGHCMYDLDHEEKPDMLMSEMMPSMAVIFRDWNHLLDDFFAAIEEENGP